jgi:hypothetical protein
MGLATVALSDVSHITDQALRIADQASHVLDPADPSVPEEGSAAVRPRGSKEAEVDDELDALDDLGDEIATLAAHLHAATYRLLTLIAEFDRLRGWEPEGHRSCAHWLAYRTGIDLGAAREKVRAARALTELPQISASMEQGELSFAKVRALTRVATPESEGDLLELARCSTAAQLERTVRAWRLMSRSDENELERIRHRSRCFSVLPDEEGMYLVRGRLDPEVGAMLMRAVEAASDALFRAGRSQAGTPLVGGSRGSASEEVEPKQRRADAIGLLAERALAVGFGGGERNAKKAEAERAGGGTSDTAGRDTADPNAGADLVPLSGTRAERYQVVLHVEASTLESGRQGESAAENVPNCSELEDGTRVSAETSRRLSCDASVVRLTKGPGGEVHDRSVHDGSVHHGSMLDRPVLDIGRKTRTIPPALRRALEARDRGCRFPGCGLRFTDAHHVTHWADGGETKLENLVLLCRFHHRLVHEEGYTVNFPRGERLSFLDPSMRLLRDVPPPPPHLPPEPVAAMLRENGLRGVEPGFLTSTARYKREDDIPLQVIMRALQAMDAAAPNSLASAGIDLGADGRQVNSGR